MKERTLTGKRKPPYRGTNGSRGRVHAVTTAGQGKLAALPWAFLLLATSAVLAAATVLGR